MPKSSNLLPNLRLDIPDLVAQTKDHAAGLQNLTAEQLLADGFPVTAEGFRVAISDQSASPRELTVVNGAAVRRDGVVVNNEDDLDAARTVTLPANGTYYIEVERIESESDADARAFWDPTYSNGTDTSGDTIPPGREFDQTVATRLTPDWQIVSPVSTTDFEVNTNPNTAKIPVAIITVSGGVIAGGTTSPLQSVIAEDIASSATSVTLLNTRAMPASFTLRLDPGGVNQEDVAVSANDQANGILTIGATTNAHVAGVRAQVAGGTPAEYLIERQSPEVPTSGTEDARSMLFRGSEARGAVLVTDQTGTGDDRADLNLENLKRYVDFLAGQLLELKTGTMDASTAGNAAPPSAFPASPRYFHNYGGVAGARAYTVSVGDGVNSFGDFNALQSGSAQAAIQAALTVGGTVYIKTGNYDITTTELVIDNDNVILIGDGPGNTRIRATDAGGASALLLENCADIQIKDLSLLVFGTGTATHAVQVTGTMGRTYISNCFIDGIDATGDVATDWIIADSKLQAPSTFSAAENLVVKGTKFPFAASETALTLDTVCDQIQIDNCEFLQSATNSSLDAVGLQVDSAINLDVVGCTFRDCDSGAALDTVTNFSFSVCNFIAPTSERGRVGIKTSSTSPAIVDGSISGCRFKDLDSRENVGRCAGVFLGESGATTVVNNLSFDNCIFDTIGSEDLGDTGNMDFVAAIVGGFTLSDTIEINVSNCVVKNIQCEGGGEAYGINLVGTAQATITGNTFQDFAQGGTATGIQARGVNAAYPDKLSIANNVFRDLGTSGSSSGLGSSAVWIGLGASSTQSETVSICGNVVENMPNGHAVKIDSSVKRVTISNNVIDLGQVSESAILVDTANAPSPFLSEIVISGNNIEGGYDAIHIETAGIIDNAESRYLINNNSIMDHDNNGVLVEGGISALGDTNSISVCGNMISSSVNTSAGIRVEGTSKYAVNSNVIYLTGTSHAYGIILFNGHAHGSVVGNVVDIESSGSNPVGINGSGVTNTLYAGNYVRLSSSNVAINAGTASFVAANLTDQQGAGAGIGLTGSAVSEARSDDDLGTDPADESDIGLNYRI